MSGKTVTYTKGDGTTGTITTQDTNTDTKVTQTVTTTDAAYPLLLAPNGQTATKTTTTYFDSGVTLNPSTNTIAANISGNAATATKSDTTMSATLTEIADGTDLDTLTTAGYYGKAGSALAQALPNNPLSSLSTGIIVKVYKTGGITFQEVSGTIAGGIYKRRQNASSWSGWIQMATTSDNVASATKLQTGRTLKVNLASTSASTAFNGNKNITDIGVSGTLPVANGGTGQTTLVNAANALMNSLGEGDTAPTDDSCFIGQGVGNYADKYYRKPISLLWNYIKGKADSVYAAITHTHKVADISDLTATAAELNKMDGVTATTAELNYVDGVTSNIQTQLNNKADKTQGVYYIEGTGSTAGTWLGSHSGITEYYPGLTILYKIPIAGASTTKLNINNLGTVNVVKNVSTAISTSYAVNSIVNLIYTLDGTTAYWKIADYDSNTKNSAGTSNKADTKLFLAGGTSQNSSGVTTYSNANVYIGTDNCLYSNGEKVATSSEVTAAVDAIPLATGTTNGLMSANTYRSLQSTTNLVAMIGGMYSLGSFYSKTVGDLQSALNFWLETYAIYANTSAVFVAGEDWVDAWNSGDTSTALNSSGGGYWTVTNLTMYSSSSKDYAHLRIVITGTEREVHLYKNVTWGQAYWTVSGEDLDAKADKTVATTTANGLMSAADKTKLNGIDANATSIPFVAGTQTAATGTWTGVASTLSSLVDGQTIRYWLPYKGNGNATLNLTLSNGTTTGAKNCYYNGTTRLTTHYAAGNIILLTYRENVSIAGSSTKYTGWWAQSDYADGNNYDRVRYQQNVKCGTTAIVAGNIIVGNNGVYQHLKSGSAFDVTYPILYADTAISASGTSTSNYLVRALTITTTQSITLTAYKPVFIKGSLSGTTFTPVSTTPLTQTVPTTADGYEYITP